MKNNFDRYRLPVVEAARKAGERILEVYRQDFATYKKADASPLTEADMAAHRVIIAALAALTPDIPVLSEESAAIDYQARASWRQFWLVDPLDGTKEFIKRNGEFTVNIALIEGGTPVLGVVHVPVTGVTYSASQTNGAWRQEADRPAQPIRVRAYHGGKAMVVASRSHAGGAVDKFLTRLRAREGEHETVNMGSSLKLCLVAEGKADIYPRLGPTSEWDTAAAQCVVEAAGGWVKDLHMRPLVYNKPSLLNPWFLVGGAGGYDWTVYLDGAG